MNVLSESFQYFKFNWPCHLSNSRLWVNMINIYIILILLILSALLFISNILISDCILAFCWQFNFGHRLLYITDNQYTHFIASVRHWFLLADSYKYMLYSVNLVFCWEMQEIIYFEIMYNLTKSDLFTI